MDIKLSADQAVVVIRNLARKQIENEGVMVKMMSEQIIGRIPEQVQQWYAKGLSLSVDADSQIGIMLLKSGVIQ